MSFSCIIRKSRYDDRGGRPAQCATHATLQPTHSPTWEEIMTMDVCSLLSHKLLFVAFLIAAVS